jgi:tetratricopeptide (TPR) repeat protein
VRRSASVCTEDIEDIELAQLINKLHVCRMQLTDKSKLDDTTTLALAAAEKLYQRSRTQQEADGHLALSLNARAYFLCVHERYSESLGVLDRFKAEFGHETPPRFPGALVFNHFYRSRALDELNRADEMEAEQRECLEFMQVGADPEVLGHAMMAVSNLVNHLMDKKSDDSRAEAKRLRERIHEVYPGPVTYECVQANYQSWNALGMYYYRDKEYAAALAAFDNVLAGQQDLEANDLGDLVFRRHGKALLDLLTSGAGGRSSRGIGRNRAPF